MAGDSPGRAEQQESSGETAGKKVDPRLAVRRDPPPPRAEAADGPADAESGERERPAEATVAVADPPRDAQVTPDAAEQDADPEPAEPEANADPAPETPPEAEPDPEPDEPADAARDAADADGDDGTADADEAGEADGDDEAVDSAGASDAPDAPGAEPESGADDADDRAADDADVEPAAVAEGAAGVTEKPSGTAEPAVEPADAPQRPAEATAGEAAAKSAPAAAEPAETPARPAQAPAKPAEPTVPPAKAPAAPAKPPYVPMPAQPPATGSGKPTGRERTKQQPLPPSPDEPLRLLAELTNTPPPPQTLLRTTARRVKIWTPLVVLLAIIFVVVQALRPLPDPTLTLSTSDSFAFSGARPAMPWPSEGQAAVQVDGLGSMGTFGAQKPEPIASVAKIMTAYIVLRDHPITSGAGAPLTVDRQAASDFNLGAEGESVVKVTAGQHISEYEALEDVMIASANNIARMLARWDAGSEAAFVKKMNTTAKRFGMGHTTYTDPSGLTATTVSTATDQVHLAQQAMANPTFRKVVGEPSYKTAGGDTYNNWNHLVGTNNVIGIKTGTSTAAGGNLVFAADKQVGGTTQLIIGAVLGQYKPSILDTVTAASLQLVLTAQQSLTSAPVIRKGDVVGYVDNGLGGRTPVVATQDVQAVGWPGVKVAIALTTTGVPHSAKAGTKVGTLTVGSGPGQIKVPVAVKTDMNAPGFGDKLTRVG